MGNESSDLDSIMGSLCLAYHRTFIHDIHIETPIDIEKIIASKHKFYIPIINCLKSEVLHRFDWNYISSLMDINMEELCYFQEFQELYTKQQNMHVILFDHNKPSKAQNHLLKAVVEVIDHHEDLNAYPKEQNVEKNIRKAGSCCSIMTEIIEDSCCKLERIDKMIVFGLYTTILIDTLNFDPKLKENRWVEKDLALFERLAMMLKEDEKYHKFLKKEQFYKELINLKYSEKHNLNLCLETIFDKDLKTFYYSYGNVMFTSVCVSPDSFMKHYTQEKIELFVIDKMNQNKLIAVFFLFIYPIEEDDQSLARDLLAFSYNNELLKKIDEIFITQKMKMEKRKYIYSEQFSHENILFFSDVERIYSRKLLEPIIASVKL